MSFSRARIKGKQGHMRTCRLRDLNGWISSQDSFATDLPKPFTCHVLPAGCPRSLRRGLPAQWRTAATSAGGSAHRFDGLVWTLNFQVQLPGWFFRWSSHQYVHWRAHASMLQAAKKLERELAGDAGEDKPKKEQLGWKCDKLVWQKRSIRF